jgi:gliding motility-associated-like protein
MKLLKHYLFYVLLLYGTLVQAQCMNTFPYTEDFEANNGNWTSGGTGNDWAWGQVSKSYIQQAASGNNCWVTGGLTNAFYNLGERSFVASPCFDLSSLQYPYISFNVFWETENQYDGAGFQYSFDSITWVNLGSRQEVALCNEGNWFNTSGINNLTGLTGVTDGWSGNTQNTQGSCQGGGGSGGWRKAEYCMAQLKGKSKVYFRFIFGAGTQCNDYDGFAFDDVYIGEAPPSTFDFTYSCAGYVVTTLPVSAIKYECLDSFFLYVDGKMMGQNVGGLLSYAINLETFITASNGLYPAFPHTITWEYRGPCHPPISVTKVIPDFQYTINATPLTCAGNNNGALEVQLTGGSVPKVLSWFNANTFTSINANPATNLPPGSYYATLIDSFNCYIYSDTITLDTPGNINTNLTVAADTCNLLTGYASTNPAGGTPPYQYQWSNGSTNASISNVAAGPYQLTVYDAGGCSVTAQAEVGYTSGLFLQVVERKDVTCFGSNDGKASILVSGGTEPYSYVWSNNANTAAIQKLPEGVYTLTVSDSQGCTDSTKIEIDKVQCESYVDFPTAFSPNGDGVNDVFRARYSPDVNKFNMRIYNRWGELVFAGNDILEGWNGTYKNVAQPMGTFVWLAEYSFRDGSSNTSSGNVTLLR